MAIAAWYQARVWKSKVPNQPLAPCLHQWMSIPSCHHRRPGKALHCWWAQSTTPIGFEKGFQSLKNTLHFWLPDNEFAALFHVLNRIVQQNDPHPPTGGYTQDRYQPGDPNRRYWSPSYWNVPGWIEVSELDNRSPQRVYHAGQHHRHICATKLAWIPALWSALPL